MVDECINVAVGVIKNQAGQVLLSKRHNQAHQGGLWEFPGGKVEVGESVTSALQRELEEEIGIYARSFRPIISIPHQYSDKAVLLSVWDVTDFEGQPFSKEDQPLAWVDIDQLSRNQGHQSDFPLPEANFGIVKAITLGSRMGISGTFANKKEFNCHLQNAITRGIQLFQCRLPLLSTGESQEILQDTLNICRENNVKFLINNHFNEAYIDGVDGYHFTAKQLMAMKEKPHFHPRLYGASCHNEAELQQAVKLDLDYVTLSPIFNTTSHPGSHVLGMDKFEQLVRSMNLPVFGLGGLGTADLEEIRLRGGQGIAAINTFWQDSI